MIRWGIVSTLKAPTEGILNFAAWHLEMGAHRLYLYLDAPQPEVESYLAAHPKIEAVRTDDAYWQKRGGRPDQHQPRQSKNARHAYNRKTEVDWLAHIDVDEFLLPDRDVAAILSDLPDKVQCARLRPIEALDGMMPDGTYAFKAYHIDPKARQLATESCFPQWGKHLSGGFVSHVAGKVFFRTGLNGLQIKIHNVVLNGTSNPNQVELPELALGHFHATSWEHFLSNYRYRLEKGSYRPELKPQVRRQGSLNHHDFFQKIEQDQGEAGLRSFYQEVCTTSPELIDRLTNHNLLRRHTLKLDTLREKHFPT